MHKYLFLREQFPHMGKHSGYDCLFQELEKSLPSISTWKIHKHEFSFLQKIKHWDIPKSFKGACPSYDKNSYAGEKNLLQKLYKTNISLIHIGYLEDCYWLLSQKKIRKKLGNIKLVCTAHLPPSWWRLNGNLNLIKNIDALIALSEESKEFFEKYLPKRVHFIPHGIKSNFFKPDKSVIKNYNRCIFVGFWLRDITLLSKVIQIISSRNNNIHFDIVIPKGHEYYQNISLLYKMARNPNVHWHSNISTNQLIKLYQQADLHLFPLIDCTANNALLEGMSCGLPTITNDIKGIQSYTNESFTCYFQNYDAYGMANKVEELLRDKRLVKKMSKNAREYAMNNLSWQEITKSTKELYQQVLK